MKVENRIKMELRIVRALLNEFKSYGFHFQLFCEGEPLSERSDNVSATMKAVRSCDEESLRVYRVIEGEWVRFGTVLLVYGNDGYDVIADNSENLEPFMTETMKLVETLS